MLSAHVSPLGAQTYYVIVLIYNSHRVSQHQRLSALVHRMMAQGAAESSCVAVAYMDTQEPTLLTVAANAITRGARQLLVLPVLLASGQYLRHDMPLLMKQLHHNHPQAQVRLLPPVLGDHPQVDVVIEGIAQSAQEANEERVRW